MGLADNLRRAAEYGRKAAAAAAQRPTTVTVVLETWDRPIGTAGAVLQSTQALVLSPAPKVEFVGDESSAFGGGIYSGPDGDLNAGRVRIGPITQSYAGGGYTPAQLGPDIAGPHQRTYLTLSGPGFVGAARYMIEKLDASRPQSIWIEAHRTKQT